MFQPVRGVRVYERVVQEIASAIVRGDLVPGSRLPSERELMQQFDVSRSTIREALRVLHSDGFVRSRAGDQHGAEVLPFTTGRLEQSLSSLARVEHLSLGELLQFRMLVEGCASQLAARFATDEDLARLEARLQDMESAAAAVDHAAFSRADLAFHDVVADAAGNKLLQISNAVVRDVVLQLLADRLASPTADANMADVCERHRQVLEAIRARDGARAAAQSRRHIADYYLSYVPPDVRERIEVLAEDPGSPDGGPG